MTEESWLLNIILGTAIVCLVVIIAMCTDLASGLYKASIRGEKKTSYGLQRTTLKCITYLGSILICYGIDVLIHMGKLWNLIGWEWMVGIPAIAILMGIFNCAVELKSVREKADAKADRETWKSMMNLIKDLRQSEATELIKALQDIVNKNKE